MKPNFIWPFFKNEKKLKGLKLQKGQTGNTVKNNKIIK